MTDITVWNGAAGTTGVAHTLSVTAAPAITIVGSASGTCVLEYTIDGSTWTAWFSTTVTLASATYTAPIPSGTNLANLAVRATSVASVPGAGSSRQSVAALLFVSNLAIL